MMRRFFLILCILFALPVQSQTPDETATLVADRVVFDQTRSQIAAEGNVEILSDSVRLRARRISYNGETDILTVDGPIYVIEPDGTVITAEFAELSGDLQEGVLKSARLVFARQLQLAANEIRRSEGRFTEFNKTTASSCQICEDNPTPLWEIRARRVVHDDEERQLYFRNAQLRVLDFPVFYLPYLRLPDPTVDRATGFLIPELISNGDFGIGLKTPYFFTLGDHADLTLTPWLTTKGSRTLEARFRRKFAHGEIQVDGAVTNDNFSMRSMRSYLFAEGAFDLVRDYKLKFDIELVSDADYLLFYDFSEKDRLDSAISVERARRDKYVGAELIHYKSLRPGDDNRTIPTLVGDLAYEQRFDMPGLGGIGKFSVEAHGHHRRQSFDPAASGLARDVARVSAVFDWRRDWTLSNGMQFAAMTELRADAYTVRQEPRPEFGDTVEVTPYAALEWRWPLMRRSGRATHLIEPVAQLVFASDRTRHVANEDSLLVEFDETNLFEFNRFPGVDGQEGGNRLNLGLTWTRYDPAGWSVGLTVGRILRDKDLNQFSVSTGLQGRSSDWLVAAQVELGDRLSITNRAVFDDQFSFSLNELRLGWDSERYRIGSTFAWLEADVAEDRPLDTSEFSFDGAFQVSRHWTLLSDLRYDFVSDRTVRAGLGLSYQNECAKVDLSLSRRFTSSSTISPVTNFRMSVQLAGFGSSGTDRGKFARQCNG